MEYLKCRSASYFAKVVEGEDTNRSRPVVEGEAQYLMNQLWNRHNFFRNDRQTPYVGGQTCLGTYNLYYEPFVSCLSLP